MHARTRHARAWVWGAIVADHRVVRARRRHRAGRRSAVQRAGERQRHLPAGRRRGDPGHRAAEEVRRTSPRCRSSCSSSPTTQVTPGAAATRWRRSSTRCRPLRGDRSRCQATATCSDFLGSAPVTAVPSEDGQAILVTVLLSEDKTTDALPNGESPVLAVVESLVRGRDRGGGAGGAGAATSPAPVGILADLISVFGDIDGTLLLATALVVTLDPDPRLPQPLPLGDPAGQRRVRAVAGQRRRLLPREERRPAASTARARAS